MDKEKIVKKLNDWVKEEFGSQYFVEDDGDLTLNRGGCGIAWFWDFKASEFTFSNGGDHSIQLIKEGIIEKFYDKAVELLNKYEHKKYTVQVLPNEYGFLYKRDGDLFDVITDSLTDLSNFPRKWSHFTQSEIDELKQRDDVAVDWDKAIIKEVKENEND